MDDNLACIKFWIPKPTNTCPEYGIIIDFLLQQWLHERALVLCFTYIACLVTSHLDSVHTPHYKINYIFHMFKLINTTTNVTLKKETFMYI
jgi:hypothetical protein